MQGKDGSFIQDPNDHILGILDAVSYTHLDVYKRQAKTIDLDIYTKKVSADEFFGIAPTVQYHMDEPLPNPSALPLYFVANTAAKQVKVVLSGEDVYKRQLLGRGKPSALRTAPDRCSRTERHRELAGIQIILFVVLILFYTYCNLGIRQVTLSLNGLPHNRYIGARPVRNGLPSA